MRIAIFFGSYFAWHYGRGVVEFFSLWKNFLWFGYHYFSVPLMFRTLFSPFHRIHETSRGFNLELMLENIVANTMMRILGFVLRSVVIAAGLVSEIVILVLGSIAFIIWILFPLIIAALIVSGLLLIV